MSYRDATKSSGEPKTCTKIVSEYQTNLLKNGWDTSICTNGTELVLTPDYSLRVLTLVSHSLLHLCSSPTARDRVPCRWPCHRSICRAWACCYVAVKWSRGSVIIRRAHEKISQAFPRFFYRRRDKSKGEVWERGKRYNCVYIYSTCTYTTCGIPIPTRYTTCGIPIPTRYTTCGIPIPTRYTTCGIPIPTRYTTCGIPIPTRY